MNLLALDPSTRTGYALLLSGSKNPILGTWALGENLSPGGYFVALCEALVAICRKYEITGDLQIIVEDKSINAIGTAWVKHLAESWVGVIETWCAARGLPAPIATTVNSWRSAFIGMSAAPKEVGAGLEEKKRSEARRKWIKAAVITECKRRGLDVKDDNAADAVGILFWHVNGGAVVQQQRRANKVARIKAKRSQKRFLFGKAA